MERTNTNTIRVLSTEEMKQTAGGSFLPQIGAAAVTYKTAYETANFFGAARFGRFLGSRVYNFFHN